MRWFDWVVYPVLIATAIAVGLTYWLDWNVLVAWFSAYPGVTTIITSIVGISGFVALGEALWDMFN